MLLVSRVLRASSAGEEEANQGPEQQQLPFLIFRSVAQSQNRKAKVQQKLTIKTTKSTCWLLVDRIYVFSSVVSGLTVVAGRCPYRKASQLLCTSRLVKAEPRALQGHGISWQDFRRVVRSSTISSDSSFSSLP